MIKVQVNKNFLKILKDNYIYSTRTGITSHKTSLGKYINRWKNGDIISIQKNALIEPFTTIYKGNNLYTCGSFSSIASEMPLNTEVGRYTSIGPNCSRLGFRHPVEAASMSSAVFNFNREQVHDYFKYVKKRDGQKPKPAAVPTPQPQFEPIKIGNDVWIGKNVTLKGGITIGDGAIIASGSFVDKSVNPYEVIAGYPATFKKYRFPKDIVDSFVKAQWWNYELSDLYSLNFENPEIFLSNLLENLDNLRPYSLKPINLYRLIKSLN